MAALVVVDDDDTMRKWLGAVLRAARHTVRAFESAEAALPHIVAHLPDLVVADINLPGKSGLDLLEALRASPRTATMPLILITSVGPRHVYRKGMELGADDFITKPLTAPEVTRAVDARLARALAASAAESLGKAQSDPGDLPARIGRFRIERRIARGVGTQVFLGRDDNGVAAAVKVLHEMASVNGVDVLKRFLHEIEIAGAVRHPHLALVLDRGIIDSGPFVAFEYFPHGDLATMVSRALAPNLACRVVVQVAAGLKALHDAGIVHRDIKPANIMVRHANSFVVTDFGTAKAMRIDTSLTPNGRIVGTPSYVSPEQITRKPVGPAADIYSLGVVFYELLTGRRPFAGADYHQVLHSHLTEKPAPLPAHLAIFAPVLERMLAKDPGARYAQADALTRDIDALAF